MNFLRKQLATEDAQASTAAGTDQSVSGISRDDLLALSMKLSKRLKALQERHAVLAMVRLFRT